MAGRDLIGLIRADADKAHEPRAAALRTLADHLDELPGDERASFHNDRLVAQYPELRSLIDGYGQLGPGAEQSFIDSVRKITAVEAFQVTPWWSMANPFSYAFWRFREQRIRCPNCAERIRREAKVCRYCGHSLDES